MILKIRDEFSRSGWFIFAEVKSIRYELLDTKNITNTTKEGDNQYFPSKEKNPKLCIGLEVHFKDKHTEHWISETTTYLLNDEGKTIEKLY